MVQLPPRAPEIRIIGAAMEQPCELVDVEKPGITSQQMPQRVQHRVSYRIGRMQRGESHAFQFPALPALPKAIQACGREALGSLIPELEMQIDGHWHFRIVEVA